MSDLEKGGSAEGSAGQNGGPQSPLSAPAHTIDGTEVYKAFETDPKLGLCHDKIPGLQEKWGPNQLKPPPKPNFFKIMVRNFLNAMTMVLVAAAAVSFGTQDWISGGVIFALVVINVSVGTVNEWQAEKTVAALESIGSPVATVLRHKQGASGEGEIIEKPTVEVVPGDIIICKIGDVIPADGRIIPGYLSSLEVDEALLTGESLPSVKQEEIIEDPDCPVGDRVNMVYSGAQVVKGRARAVVVATGMNTELGKIASAMDREEARKETGFAYYWYKFKVSLGVAGTTPLQMKLNSLAYILLGLACLLAVVVVATTAFSDVPLTIATYAVATAVSLLPASLVAVVALSLANASKDLADRNALVRRMDAVETLAAVTDVCSDKTGTITVGKMVLKNAWVPGTGSDPGDGNSRSPVDTSKGQHYSVESGSEPFYPRGAVRPIAQFDASKPPEEGEGDEDEDEGNDFNEESSVHPHHMERRLRDLVLCGSLCNTATIHKNHETDSWEANGDATEVAITVFVHKLGHGRAHLTRDLSKHNLEKTMSGQSDKGAAPKAPTEGSYEPIVEHPFDSGIKRMTTAYKFNPVDGGNEEAHCVVFLKGAIERVFDSCSYVGMDAKHELNQDEINKIQARADELAGKGLRVLTMCGKRVGIDQAETLKTAPREETEKTGFCFLGLVGIYDPPRPESKFAVADCHRASIIPRMLTGDHKATATAIAQLVGIIGHSYSRSAVMTGPEFDKLTDDQVDELEELPRVIARCAPETKVRVVEALHRKGRLAVMTGDGVNDAPSLKRADVGFAMGKNGSDVAKQSAEVVLADDNFSTIIRAIRKGRSVFSNLSKFLLYLLSCNVGQVLLLVIGLAFQDQTGESTFPISPVGALWINTLSAGPPALALGLEPTDKNAMDKRPEDFKSIFVLEWWLDLFFYGVLMGAISLANFAIAAYAYNDGYLGIDCNSGYRSECDNVFRARGAVFATFLLVLMLHALYCKKPTLSLFQTNLLDNKFLLWTVALLCVSVFPVIYIPVINQDVFYVNPLGWEWGMVFASVLVYMVFAEMWKFVRKGIERKTLAAKAKADEEHDKELRMENTAQPRSYV